MEVKVDFLLNIYLHNNYIALTYENIIYLERIPLLKAYHDDDYSKKKLEQKKKIITCKRSLPNNFK